MEDKKEGTGDGSGDPAGLADMHGERKERVKRVVQTVRDSEGTGFVGEGQDGVVGVECA